MGTDSILAGHPGSLPSSVVTASVRADFAEAVARTVERVAGHRGAPEDLTRDVQAKLLHNLFHWIARAGTHFLEVRPTLARIERLAGRLIDRGIRRPERKLTGGSLQPWRPIGLGTLLKAWQQLTFEEQRVLRLGDLKYGLEDIALILDVTPNAVEFYRSQARRKIHNTYLELC